MILEGDVLDRLSALATGSVHSVVTSPPYWGLRDYGVDGQIGLEPTLEEYLCRLVSVFREVRRVMRTDGTLWLNMGDAYSGGGGYSPDAPSNRAGSISSTRAERTTQYKGRAPAPGLKPKDLIGQPWRLAFALQDDGWWLRSDIIWHKPNPMPESATDRPTKAHEYVFLLTPSARYFYDADAVREPVTGNAHSRGSGVNPKAVKTPDGWTTGPGSHGSFHRNGREKGRIKQNQSFSAAVKDLVPDRNLRDVWTIATQPFPQAHFATFPEALVDPCIRAGCPPDGTVLDPFAGSGTVGVVCHKLQRQFIGIELNPEYAAIARRRIGEVEGLFAREAAEA